MIPQVMIPQPDPLPQPGPTWLLWTLLMVTFIVHLLAMNSMLGGAIIGAVARWRRHPGSDDRSAGLIRSLAGLMPVFVAVAVSFGVAALLFAQVLYGRLLFSSSVLLGWWWLAVIPILITAYYAHYWLAMRPETSAGTARAVGALGALLLLTIGFIYVNNMSLVWRPDRFTTLYSTVSSHHLNVGDPTFIPRFLHMGLGAVAVAGVAVALIGLSTRHRDEAQARWLIRHGAWWFVLASGVNLLAGIWWLVSLPRDTLIRFMSQDVTAALVLALGIVVALVPLTLMALALQVPRPWGLVRAAASSTVLTVALMATTRDQLRRAAIAAGGFEPTPWVAPQWGPIVLFVVLLLVALGSIWWMVSVLARGRSSGPPAAEV